MDTKRALFAILGGVALTTVIGFLLSPYKDTSSRKKIADKARDYTDDAEEFIQDSVANVKNRVKKMGEDADRMLNEGGKSK